MLAIDCIEPITIINIGASRPVACHAQHCCSDGRRYDVSSDSEADHFSGGVCGGEGDLVVAGCAEITVSGRMDK